MKTNLKDLSHDESAGVVPKLNAVMGTLSELLEELGFDSVIEINEENNFMDISVKKK